MDKDSVEEWWKKRVLSPNATSPFVTSWTAAERYFVIVNTATKAIVAHLDFNPTAAAAVAAVSTKNVVQPYSGDPEFVAVAAAAAKEKIETSLNAFEELIKKLAKTTDEQDWASVADSRMSITTLFVHSDRVVEAFTDAHFKRLAALGQRFIALNVPARFIGKKSRLDRNIDEFIDVNANWYKRADEDVFRLLFENWNERDDRQIPDLDGTLLDRSNMLSFLHKKLEKDEQLTEREINTLNGRIRGNRIMFPRRIVDSITNDGASVLAAARALETFDLVQVHRWRALYQEMRKAASMPSPPKDREDIIDCVMAVEELGKNIDAADSFAVWRAFFLETWLPSLEPLLSSQKQKAPYSAELSWGARLHGTLKTLRLLRPHRAFVFEKWIVNAWITLYIDRPTFTGGNIKALDRKDIEEAVEKPTRPDDTAKFDEATELDYVKKGEGPIWDYFSITILVWIQYADQVSHALLQEAVALLKEEFKGYLTNDTRPRIDTVKTPWELYDMVMLADEEKDRQTIDKSLKR